MANKWDVDFWIEGRANSLIKSFYPTKVAKDTDLPLQFVFDRLLELTQDDKLVLKWEVRCPNCQYTLHTFDTFPLINEGDSIYCDAQCHEEIELDIEYIFPVFEFCPSYRDSLRVKEMQKKKSLVETSNKKEKLTLALSPY